MAKLKGAANWSDYWSTYGLGVALVVAAFVVAYQYVNPAPPTHIVMATGGPGGAYQQFAQRYRSLLEESGVELVVRSTAGSVENLMLLDDPEGAVDLAFVQGGVELANDESSVVGLGSVFLEPVWVFYRSGLAIRDLRDLAGMSVYVGPMGSGTRHLALRLLADNGVELPVPLAEISTTEDLIAALNAGEIDAVFVVASPLASSVQALLRANSVTLLDMTRAEAYERRYPFLEGVALPRGTFDLVNELPDRDVRLLAATAMLAARDSLHPALVDLLLEVAADVHAGGGIFESPGAFPSPHHMNLPLNSEAERFYDYGPPLLRRHLPFWAATLIDRLKIMLLPLVAVMIPLLRATPPLYRWRVRRRIYRWYDELGRIDPELGGRDRGLHLVDRDLEALDRLEQEVQHVSVPLPYADQLFNLRMHIGLVRGRLTALRDEAA